MYPAYDFVPYRLPVMANNGLPGHVACMSAYPPTCDIRWPMSVIVPISSALPPAPDVADVPGECLNLSSHAEGFHLRVLPEPCVKLSLHTAPDVRPFP